MVLSISASINYYQLMDKPALRSTGEAPPYVVVRFYQDPEAAAGHDHVTAIETRDPDGGTTRWRSIDVIAAIRAGERFVVEEDGQDRESVLEPALCLVCPRATVKVSAAEEPPTLG
jgi:hypothetical protein